MKKLKTLKEIESWNGVCNVHNCDCYHNDEYNWIDENELRQEAIKRAKNIMYEKNIKIHKIIRNKDNTVDLMWRGEDEFAYWTGKLCEIIEFNNLTEEDLKI